MQIDSQSILGPVASPSGTRHATEANQTPAKGSSAFGAVFSSAGEPSGEEFSAETPEPEFVELAETLDLAETFDAGEEPRAASTIERAKSPKPVLSDPTRLHYDALSENADPSITQSTEAVNALPQAPKSPDMLPGEKTTLPHAPNASTQSEKPQNSAAPTEEPVANSIEHKVEPVLDQNQPRTSAQKNTIQTDEPIPVQRIIPTEAVEATIQRASAGIPATSSMGETDEPANDVPAAKTVSHNGPISQPEQDLVSKTGSTESPNVQTKGNEQSVRLEAQKTPSKTSLTNAAEQTRSVVPATVVSEVHKVTPGTQMIRPEAVENPPKDLHSSITTQTPPSSPTIAAVPSLSVASVQAFEKQISPSLGQSPNSADIGQAPLLDVVATTAGSENARNGVGFPVTAPTARSDAPAFATQIAEILMSQSGRRVDIALQPEELGRVRMTLGLADGSTTIVIAAERQETLDLMRRHADALSEALRALGHNHVSFDFQHQSSTEAGPDRDDRETPANGTADGSENSEAIALTIPLRNASPGMETGLDIRL
ncbi:MAG: flagellar hook-length control protein FliK [Paracoccaceae bacterium]